MDNSEIPKQRLTGRVWCDFPPARIQNFAVQNLHLKIFDKKVHFFLERKITERRLRWSEGTRDGDGLATPRSSLPAEMRIRLVPFGFLTMFAILVSSF